MLTITDAALERLHAALVRKDVIDACFRFTRRDNDTIGLIVEKPHSSDQTFEHEGETVLATPEQLAELLSKRVLDLDDEGKLILIPQSALN